MLRRLVTAALFVVICSDLQPCLLLHAPIWAILQIDQVLPIRLGVFLEGWWYKMAFKCMYK